MRAQQFRLDAVANNLANVATDGYKKDVAAFKAFPELLIRRQDDDGVYQHPFGSADVAPVVGKMGTGVELNELFTNFDQGSPKETSSDFDIMLDGRGFFSIATPWGERYTRNGSFQLGKEGILETKEGYPVLGENGYIKVKANNFIVDKDGKVWINAAIDDDPNVMVSKQNNTWEDTQLLDTLKIVEFDIPRYLEKQGSSLYRETGDETNNKGKYSGPPMIMTGEQRPKVLQGFIEASNVNPVTEMVEMIEVNRSYERIKRLSRLKKRPWVR